MADTEAVTALASAARDSSSVGAAVELGAAPRRTTVELLLDITAASGTDPTLLVTIETSADGALGWRAVTPLGEDGEASSFASASAEGSERVVFPGCDRYIRVRWVIGGTNVPSFTFSVSGLAVLVYATPAAMFQLGCKEETFQGISYADLDKALRGATGRINDTFGAITELPLDTWGDSTERACAILGAVNALTTRGPEPTAPADDWLMRLYTEIVGPEGHPEAGWLGQVAAGTIVPEGVVDQTEDEEEGGVYAYTDARRGW